MYHESIKSIKIRSGAGFNDVGAECPSMKSVAGIFNLYRDFSLSIFTSGYRSDLVVFQDYLNTGDSFNRFEYGINRAVSDGRILNDVVSMQL